MIRLNIYRFLTAVAAAAWCGTSADAQEVSVFSVVGGSSQPTLTESGGFGVSGVIAPSRWVRVEGSFTTVERDSRRTAVVCGSYIPRANCQEEQLSENFMVRSFRISYAPLAFTHPRVGLAIKAGLSISQIISDSRPESARSSNLQHPRTGQDGRFVGAELSFTPVQRVPLSITAGWISQWIDFTGCQKYGFQFAPFCGIDRFDELQGGAAIRIRR